MNAELYAAADGVNKQWVLGHLGDTARLAKIIDKETVSSETTTWVRAEIRRLDKQCKQATTPRGQWYCL
jgi:hypothetical protein